MNRNSLHSSWGARVMQAGGRLSADKQGWRPPVCTHVAHAGEQEAVQAHMQAGGQVWGTCATDCCNIILSGCTARPQHVGPHGLVCGCTAMTHGLCDGVLACCGSLRCQTHKVAWLCNYHANHEYPLCLLNRVWARVTRCLQVAKLQHRTLHKQ